MGLTVDKGDLMAFIRTIDPEKAHGLLRRLYDEAVQRAGRVWNVVRLMSLKPDVLQASMKLYSTLMYSRSKLSRSQREMIATVVSRVNNCYY